MAYEENPDPLTGKGRRHTASALSVLGLSKSVIVDDEEDVKIIENVKLLQGDIVTWKTRKNTYIGVINLNSVGNTYEVLLLEPNHFFGRFVSINRDAGDDFIRVDVIQNKNKELKVGDNVTIYWRYDTTGKMSVGKGKIVKRERTDVIGMFPNFYTYDVALENASINKYNHFPSGYIVKVYEHRGKESGYEKILSESEYEFDRFPYKVNRIWKTYEPKMGESSFTKVADTNTEHIWTKNVNSFVSLAVRVLKQGGHWVVTYRWEIENKNHEVVSQDIVYTKVYKDGKYALRDAKHIMTNATLDDYKNFADKRIVELYEQYLSYSRLKVI